MKNMKKLFALVLALALCFSLALPAMAADDHTHTMTINGVATGHTYDIYQIFAGDMAEKDGKLVLSNIKWGTAVQYDTNNDSDYADEGEYDFSAAIIANLKDPVTAGILLAGNNADEIKADFANVETAEDVAKVLKDGGYSDKGVFTELFAKIVGDTLANEYAKSENANKVIQLVTATATTTNPKIYTAQVIDGYYLVKDRADSVPANDYYTNYLLSVPENTSLTVKGDVPEAPKTVNETANGTYQEKIDAVMALPYYYKWEGEMPTDIEDYQKYKYVFTDTLPTGVVPAYYDTNGNLKAATTVEELAKAIVSVQVVSVAEGGGTTEVTLPIQSTTYPNGYSLTWTNNQFKLSFDDLIAAFQEATEEDTHLVASDKVVVKYRTMLTSDASISVEGMRNDVTLTFSNNPNDYGEESTTPEDPAFVFTFGLNMFKVDASDATKHLPGAKFDLYMEESITGGGVRKTYAILEQIVDEEGETPVKDVYAIVGWTQTPAADRVQIVTDNDTMGVQIKGLDGGDTYYLHETEAPSGYNLPKSDTSFQITPTITQEQNGEWKVTDIDYAINGNTVHERLDGDGLEEGENGDGVFNLTDAVITLDITNGAGTTLPSTGGVGTTMFYVAGGIMVVAAVILLITKKRMAEEN